MMRRGIMIFDAINQSWELWFGQQSYETFEGMNFELRIRNQYFQAVLGKDEDWFVALEEDVTFDLRVFEVYKIRIVSVDSITLFDDAPF